MMGRKLFLLLTLFLCDYLAGFGQNGILRGKITDATNQFPIPFASIALQGTVLSAVSDTNGNFIINDIPPGLYNVIVSVIGYEGQTASEVNVTGTKSQVINFDLNPSTITLSEIGVSASRFEKRPESPLSRIEIHSAEIMRNPGGNRDISKVLQSFPGVASTVSFRNDIIIRGGAPSENRFFIDGIETPNINHFATQGSSGGPVGMINVNLISQAELFTGAFPASKGNALSSVLDLRLKNGNPDRLVTNLSLGSSDVGLTLDGPLSKRSDFIFSIRRSYLQLLFSALKLPFLPTYNDGQFKFNFRLDNKSTISVIGLGAFDKSKLNKSVNNGIDDQSLIERNEYILGYLPEYDQWNYTLGIKYVYAGENGFRQVIISRNALDNTAVKYENNDDSDPANRILDYNSSETENKIRIESTQYTGLWKVNYGISYEYALYTNRTYNLLYVPAGITEVNFSSSLALNKGGLFLQASRPFINNRLLLSAGLRADLSDYSESMSNIAEQLSPRVSASFRLTNKLAANLSLGRYFQLPPFTVLGYRDSAGVLVNRDNNLKFIRSDQGAFGFEFLADVNTKYSVETFYKKYSGYPLLKEEGISLANLGSDFGVIGNAPVTSLSEGRSYGVEFFIQRSIRKGFYGLLSYTFVYSEFTNITGRYLPSAWDSRHLISVTGGREFKRHWEIGIKFRYFGGTPFTPYDESSSALKTVWNVSQRGVPDYSNINGDRLPAYHQADIRIDKKYFFRKMTLNIYLDIQNIYNNKVRLQPYLTTVKDSDNMPVEDPNDSSRYLLKEIPNESGTVLPSLGIMLEF